MVEVGLIETYSEGETWALGIVNKVSPMIKRLDSYFNMVAVNGPYVPLLVTLWCRCACCRVTQTGSFWLNIWMYKQAATDDGTTIYNSNKNNAFLNTILSAQRKTIHRYAVNAYIYIHILCLQLQDWRIVWLVLVCSVCLLLQIIVNDFDGSSEGTLMWTTILE